MRALWCGGTDWRSRLSGTDPCYGTAKTLAVAAVGCTSLDNVKFVVDFGENLAGVTRIKVHASWSRGCAGFVPVVGWA